MNRINKWYSKQGLWSLFLICAFPLHLWALLIIFSDVSWVAERSNAWDALGVASYGLLFTFVESVLFFGAAVLLGFLTPKRWLVDRRVTFLSLLALILATWAIIGQLAFLLKFPLPASLAGLLAATAHPVRIMFAAAFALVAPTVLVPTLWIMHSERPLRFLRGLFERLSLLSMFYLFFDGIGLIIVLIRNIS